jgi:hypothetical protein
MSATVETILLYTIGAGLLSIVYGFFTGKNILGFQADQLVKKGVTDSQAYLQIALDDLCDWKISHIAISIECLNPKSDPIQVIQEKLYPQVL